MDAITGQLVTVSCGDNPVSFKSSVDDLATDVLVGDADDHSVLRRVVLVLGLK